MDPVASLGTVFTVFAALFSGASRTTIGSTEAENRRKIDLPAEARNVPSRPLMNVTITV